MSLNFTSAYSFTLFLPGGTLIECKNGLYRLGAAKVSAFVTHAVFPLESWKRFTQVPSLLISRQR